MTKASKVRCLAVAFVISSLGRDAKVGKQIDFSWIYKNASFLPKEIRDDIPFAINELILDSYFQTDFRLTLKGAFYFFSINEKEIKNHLIQYIRNKNIRAGGLIDMNLVIASFKRKRSDDLDSIYFSYILAPIFVRHGYFELLENKFFLTEIGEQCLY